MHHLPAGLSAPHVVPKLCRRSAVSPVTGGLVCV